MKIIRSIDDITREHDNSGSEIEKIENPRLRKILRDRIPQNQFMFSFLGLPSHKDHKEHYDEGVKGSYHCHSDSTDHTDYRKHREHSDVGCGHEYYDSGGYEDTYTEGYD